MSYNSWWLPDDVVPPQWVSDPGVPHRGGAPHTHQVPPAHSGNLTAPAAISATTSVHAAESPVLPLKNLRADAPGATELQCALKGGRPLPHADQSNSQVCSTSASHQHPWSNPAEPTVHPQSLPLL
jgi:hypothetical protein